MNPNEYCTQYSFNPPQNELAVDTQYSLSVDYANPAGGAERHDWSFNVLPPGRCVNAPVITRLSPSQGQWGRCISIIGKHFGDGALRGDDDAYATLNLDSISNNNPDELSGDVRTHWTSMTDGGVSIGATNEQWKDTHVTASVPDLTANHADYIPTNDSIDLNFFIKTTPSQPLFNQDGERINKLQSNSVNFRVFTDQDAYAGPCLFSISPSSGTTDTLVTLSGERFMSGDGARNVLLDTDPTNIYNWNEDTRIQTRIPEAAHDGLMTVLTPLGISNGLPFDVSSGEGEACSAMPNPICIPDQSICQQGLVCGTSCTCEAPKDTGSTPPLPPGGSEDSCTTNDDCISSNASGVCTSTCVNNTCQPVVTGFSPAAGPIGTWITVEGCYLGSRGGEVRIGDTLTLDVDDEFCRAQGTWSPQQIVRQVAPASYGGNTAITVLRRDGVMAQSSGQFSVGGTELPGICRVQPPAARRNTTAHIYGKKFGSFVSANLLEWAVLFGSTTMPDLSVRTNQLSTASGCPSEGWVDGDICVTVVSGAPSGSGYVKVISGGNESNRYSFRVIDSVERPSTALDLTMISRVPGALAFACMNAIVDMTFDGIIDDDTVTDATVVVTNQNGAIVPGLLSVRHFGSLKSRVSFSPSETLSPSTVYTVTVSSGLDGIRSASQGELVAGGVCDTLANDQCVFNVTTVNAAEQEAQCQVDHLSVEPADQVYFCAGKDNCDGDYSGESGHQRLYEARNMTARSQPVTPPADAQYLWESSVSSILSAEGSAESNKQQFTILPKNGSTRITASIENTAIQGATEARVFLCENPWSGPSPAYFGAPFIESETNFSTFYCRDRGGPGTGDDLPALNDPIISTNRTSTNSSLDVVRELFFIQPFGSRKCSGGDSEGSSCTVNSDCGTGGQCVGSSDAIGIRALANPQHYTTDAWYQKQSFPKGAPQHIAVDGYGGLRDGRSVYIGAPNLYMPASTNTLFSNIYLLSYNESAHSDTIDIFNQLLSNWRFGISIENVSDRDKVRRDLTRLNDMRYISDAIEQYAGSAGGAPPLYSGTFEEGRSTSVWPSWNGSLAADLGMSLPVDPLNTIPSDQCVSAGADAETCWSSTTKSFTCLPGTYVYQYSRTTDASSFLLRSMFEFKPNLWRHPTDSSWGWQFNGNGVCYNVTYGANR